MNVFNCMKDFLLLRFKMRCYALFYNFLTDLYRFYWLNKSIFIEYVSIYYRLSSWPSQAVKI